MSVGHGCSSQLRDAPHRGPPPADPRLSFRILTSASRPRILVPISFHRRLTAVLHCTSAACLGDVPLAQQPSPSHFPPDALNPPDFQTKAWLRSCLVDLENFCFQPRSSKGNDTHGGEGLKLKIELCGCPLGIGEGKTSLILLSLFQQQISQIILPLRGSA